MALISWAAADNAIELDRPPLVVVDFSLLTAVVHVGVPVKGVRSRLG